MTEQRRNPNPRRVVDLDAARAARAETNGGPLEVVLGGQTFELPAEMPLEVPVLFSAGDLRGGIALLVGDDRVDAFLATGLSDADVEELVRTGYGLALPE